MNTRHYLTCFLSKYNDKKVFQAFINNTEYLRQSSGTLGLTGDGYAADRHADQVKHYSLSKEPYRVSVEMFYQPSTKAKHVQDMLLREISQVTTLAWDDFGDVVQRWFDWSSLIVLAKVDGNVIGFNACKFEDENVLLFLASFVLPEYQSEHIAKKMQNLMVKSFLQNRGRRRFFAPAWFTFRTQNPRVMQTVSKFKAFPRANGMNSPSPKVVSIAKGVAARFSPDCEFDETNFVLKGALKDKPDLLSQDNVFYSKNDAMNRFCQRHMEYEKQAGNLFIPVGRLTWVHKMYFWLMF